MKMKTLIVSGAAIAVAGGLTFGGLALAEQQAYVAPVEQSTSTIASTPSATPTETPTPTPTETATPTPEPTQAAPAPAPKAAPVVKDPPPAPAPTTAIERNWPKFVPVVPQPTGSNMPEGYQVTADGTWFLGCGEGDTSCSWTAGPAPKP